MAHVKKYIYGKSLSFWFELNVVVLTKIAQTFKQQRNLLWYILFRNTRESIDSDSYRLRLSMVIVGRPNILVLGPSATLAGYLSQVCGALPQCEHDLPEL